MCIRDRYQRRVHGELIAYYNKMKYIALLALFALAAQAAIVGELLRNQRDEDFASFDSQPGFHSKMDWETSGWKPYVPDIPRMGDYIPPNGPGPSYPVDPPSSGWKPYRPDLPKLGDYIPPHGP
eukprot:TRINITY_DN2208_c0_g1_i1.p3 TRINITY_DN2208_c0_g1~~TRINITY_DN2208_c0_g1_i1.p3  ORF type:complete len:124 (+),score=32.44 TRINITY_DN2208_c0_g1_i1:66-437(+)